MIAYFLRNAFCGNISFQKMYGEYKAQGNIVQFEMRIIKQIFRINDEFTCSRQSYYN